MYFCVNARPGTPEANIRKVNGSRYMKRDVLAFEGKCRVEVEGDSFFGNGKSFTKELVNPTWGNLFSAAISSQKRTGDRHHSFFEGAEVLRVEADGTKVLYLYLGS